MAFPPLPGRDSGKVPAKLIGTLSGRLIGKVCGKAFHKAPATASRSKQHDDTKTPLTDFHNI